jgi:chromosome transmission fidelity protein 1
MPQGVVAFFPSFAYAEHAVSRWCATGAWAKLVSKKAVFQEPR